MSYTKIKLKKGAMVYCAPEILAPIPSNISKKEQELLNILRRTDFTYVLSAQIVLTAENNGNSISIKENTNSIEYKLDKYDLNLEKKIQALIIQQGQNVGEN